MSTKLSRYCEGVMEAAWLAAAILTPVFFNVYSSRIFEPDKIALLRSLALVLLFAWVIKLVEQARRRDESVPSTDQDRQAVQALKRLLSIPLLAPVILLAAVYILATVFSVTPRVSLWGSYQRLQGAYTTFSYLILFAGIAANLRRRAQVERLFTTMILASLPVSLYAVLQRYQLDPVPWGGDVSVRVTSTMGNSIFVAAYLIMVFPLTIGRVVESFGKILKEQDGLGGNVARASIYVFTATVQFIALFMSQSRGPFLGWLAGSFFLFVLLSLYWRKRWMTISIVSSALVVAVVLTLLNIPGGPLEGVRNLPGLGRLGNLLDPESRTGRVRVLIWNGASRLVAPHPPLEYPDGSKDTFNFLRPLIGYGPESMYVAFNSFYPPELGTIERRNASPDRSHNETWDSLVITGALGLVAYLALFVSIFYHGMKWIGLIKNARQRNLYLSLCLGGGLVGATLLVALKGVEYFGVGLPFGIAIGLIVYVAFVALTSSPLEDISLESGDATRLITLIVLTSAIFAHFVEINFGIAIASTRTYFWIFAALLLAAGYVLPGKGEYRQEKISTFLTPNDASKGKRRQETQGSRKKRRKTEKGSPLMGGLSPTLIRYSVIGGLVLAVLLVALGYDFISNPSRTTAIGQILWISFARLPTQDYIASYGILAMLLLTWLFGATLIAAENRRLLGEDRWLPAFAITLAVSGAVAFIFWMWHAISLATVARIIPSNANDVINQAAMVSNLLTKFFIFLILLLFGLAFYLPGEWPARPTRITPLGTILAPGMLFLVLGLSLFTNLRVIHADTSFKMADSFTQGDQWPVASLLYKLSIQLSPSEDFYYLFLGRSYLEQAKNVDDPDGQMEFVQQAERDLNAARRINPLNTDHTANLGRLYSWWTSRTEDETLRQERGQVAAKYYEKATTLSPNSARLWDEWAVLYIGALDEPERAFELLSYAQKIDPTYDWTYALLAEYYIRISREQTDEPEKKQALEQAAINFNKAMELPNTQGRDAWISYNYSLGGLFTELGRPDSAIAAYQEALDLGPSASSRWIIEEAIARVYAQTGDITSALEHANQALSMAPEAQKPKIQALIEQYQASP